MAEIEVIQIFLAKADQCLAGAESEFVNGRLNNTANRCYYACFHAAIAALVREGIAPRWPQWGHEFVHAQFVGQLVTRRKVYPADLRQVLANAQGLRQKADYRGAHVTQREASHGLEWSQALVTAVQRVVQGGGETQ